MKITSDENVNQAVEQMVQAIRNTDAYLEYQKQLARVKEQSELKRQIDEMCIRDSSNIVYERFYLINRI